MRFAACKFLASIIRCVQAIISEESCRDIYPSLLERLDDSQDPIRIEICTSIKLFLRCKNVSRSSVEYLVKAIVIHLDD